MKLLLLALLLLPFSAEAALKLETKGKKKNFLYEQDSKALVSSVDLVFRTGSMTDPRGKEGLSAFAFQSLLRGTKKLERKEFFAAVERLGAGITVDTASNRTIVTLNAVSENLEDAIKILAEAVLQPGLKDAEINSLKEEELAQLHEEQSNNRAILKRVFQQAIFRGTNLAFPAQGTIDGMKAISPQDVRNFLAEQIRAGNVVVAVNSSHPQKKVKEWMETAFAEFPEGKAPKTAAPSLKAQEGRHLFVVDRKGSSTTEVAIGHTGFAANYADRQILETGLFVLGADMSSRLFQVLRGQNGWTYGAYASFQMVEIPRRTHGSFLIYTFPQAEHTEKATLKALEIYDEYVKSGVTQKELDFAKKSLTNSYPFKFATSRSRLTAKLYEYLDGAPLLSVPAYRKLVNGISRAQLLAAEKKIHDPNNLVIVLVGDPAQTEALKKNIPNLKSVTVISDPMKAF
jgi:zinc protease